MKNILFIFSLFILFLGSCDNIKTKNGKPKVLIFYKTSGYKHASIPNGIAAIQKLGKENNFEVDSTNNANKFTDNNLKKYAAVIFLNTTGDVLNYKQEIAFERFIQASGGFVGIHAATDTEYDWKWYGKLVGAYFTSHPKIQQAKFIIKDKAFGATKFFKDTIWQRTDELYNFKEINPDIKVLISIDENSYQGGKNGDFHPMSWYHAYDGGRAFYTELGHTKESYSEEKYLKHLLGGIKYAIGKNKVLNYEKATSSYPPDQDRFTKTQLSQGEFFEPTEMTILPNLDVLIAQRRGEIMLYKQATKKVQQVGFLDVYYKTLHTPSVNAEEGLMGLQKDPNFEKNNWVYMYYSPTGDQWINRLSRFTFKNDILDMKSEKIILEIKTQREICCHTGGSIAFGPKGLLYLSTGDNSTPFNEGGQKYVNNGYAPLNDTPGHQQYDARRSSGNTNDLRGKVIRIKINDDGSYEIPKGNLFPVGMKKTRPEIYTMGHRNPYRIFVDPKNGYLYWGDVGPDARNDSLSTRGPRGYDEMNQARKAGNYGWPLFIANNLPYHEYNYETGKSGKMFDVNRPLNNSKNNTGLKVLPKPKAAFIWYPYAKSNQFPEVESGGRTAMAGPVYYSDLYPKKTRYPNYYDGKLIVRDWIRGWMKAVTFFPNGDFDKMEPFATNVKTNSMIDLEIGPDGRLYGLEYGSGWFTKNEDSGLARIDFNGGNRAPEIIKFEVSNTSGKLPFKINATIDAIDRDKNSMKYVWFFGNGKSQETKTPQIEYTYKNAGEYGFYVMVTDDNGASTKSKTIPVYAGNERPKVNIEIMSQEKAYFTPGQPLSYKVSVSDSDEIKDIDTTKIVVYIDYVEGIDNSALGKQSDEKWISGKVLTQTNDCKVCHKENEKSIGPSFMKVSKKYQHNKNASKYLENKIIQGGSGVWGDVVMASHPELKKEELDQMIRYILQLINKPTNSKTLPISGTVIPDKAKSEASLIITASYTDKGSKEMSPLTGLKKMVIPSKSLFLKNQKSKED